MPFVLALDASGTFLWSRAFVVDNYGYVNGLVATPQGVLAAGRFAVGIDVGGGHHPAIGQDDLYFAWLDGSGGYVANRFWGDGNRQDCELLRRDPAGELLFGGPFTGQIDFGGAKVLASNGTERFLAKLDPSGAHLWSAHYPIAPGSTVDAALDPAGNAYLAGTFTDADGLDFGTGLLHTKSLGIFLVKLGP